ncbi:hypothetical protein AX14_006335 [Amanita brunnescens Koide BX004]|nr:hypothetical protein AX14_006335 [Amanita brunnescens Koide BX004]
MFASGYSILFPPEILDEIIDHIDDKSMLLSFGLICGRVLVKSRRRLFSSLEFADHESFDCFLHLAGAPWTSFTLAVTEIHLQDVFHHNFRYRYKWEPIQVASNLRNVRSLSISAHKLWKPGWQVVPRSVLDVIFQLNLHDLQIDAVGKWRTEDVVMLFSRLPPSVKTLAFRRLRFREAPDLSRHLDTFRRPFRFRNIDNISLALLRDVLDPSSNPNLDVAVQAFHIRNPDVPLAHADNLLTSRFLRHIGHHLEQLLITFNMLYRDSSLAYLEPTQIAQCIDIRMLFVGFPDLAYKTPLLLSAMWKMLSALPAPNALHEFWFKFTPYQSSFEDQMSSLGFFESPNLLHRLRHMFSNLKIIKIILDTWGQSRCDLYFEGLRRATDLRAFEEIGFVKLVAAGTKEHVACHSILEGCDYL